MSKTIRIGSRGSDLALWQAHFFQGQLDALGVPSELIVITTKGDRIQDLSFDKIEGKGFFTKEIEEQLLSNQIDVAIHSHKDLETQMPPGLKIAGVSYREDPSELLLIRKECVDRKKALGMRENAIVGTSSARRKGQITSLRPDVTIKDIRGNVPTRIQKLRDGHFDAILLAFAGVHRLGLDLSDLFVQKLDPHLFIPAPAQGVLAFQCREDDEETTQVIQQLHDPRVAEQIAIERGILSGFGGGCHIPIGVFASPSSNGFDVRVSFAKEWETINRRVRFSASGKADALSKFESLKGLDGLPKSVFVSRRLPSMGYFKRACQEFNISLHEDPLIRIEATPFSARPENYDWVFFSSSNGVRHFFEQVEKAEWKHLKFGVIGDATATVLANYVDNIAFVGEGGNTQAIAHRFADFIGNTRVLLPSSSRTINRMAEALEEAQATVIDVYTTSLLTKSIPDVEAYVFTSPSNVDAFFESRNQIASGASVVAIGNATQNQLLQHGVKCQAASIPHDAELFALMASN